MVQAELDRGGEENVDMREKTEQVMACFDDLSGSGA